jgi:hypothetical protein
MPSVVEARAKMLRSHAEPFDRITRAVQALRRREQRPGGEKPERPRRPARRGGEEF